MKTLTSLEFFKTKLLKIILTLEKLLFSRSPTAVWVIISSLWIVIFFISGANQRPPIGDEGDYLLRGIGLIEIGINTLADGYRPPLFPILISLLYKFVGNELLLNSTRLLNIALVSIVPAIWSFQYQRSDGETKFAFMALLTALWAPFYMFAFSALAEAASFLFLNLLLVSSLGLLKVKKLVGKLIFITAFLIACLFFLKANNILVALPLGVFIFLFSNGNWLKKFWRVGLLTIFSAILVASWPTFLYQKSGHLVATTTGGLNLLVGTGYYNFGMEEDYSAIHNIKKKELYNGVYPTLTQEQMTLLKSVGKDKYSIDNVSKNIAMSIWSNNTENQIYYSCFKIAHSLGMSFRGTQDYITFTFFLLTIFASISLKILRANQNIIFLHWGLALMGFIIAFFWLPNIRFKTFYFDTTGLYLISCFISSMLPTRSILRHQSK
ncbi:hypothetical protein N9387_01510 [Candidatus Pelagibacter sp.]|nr:hypothetical protein [Candidatus Pelagibacter sp.]